MIVDRANRRNPPLVRCRHASTAYARPSSAACSAVTRSAGVSPPTVLARVRAIGKYNRNAASSRSATGCQVLPALAR